MGKVKRGEPYVIWITSFLQHIIIKTFILALEVPPVNKLVSEIRNGLHSVVGIPVCKHLSVSEVQSSIENFDLNLGVIQAYFDTYKNI